jgi:hypothetical protein
MSLLVIARELVDESEIIVNQTETHSTSEMVAVQVSLVRTLHKDNDKIGYFKHDFSEI